MTDSRSSSPSDRDEIRSVGLTPRRRRLPSKLAFGVSECEVTVEEKEEGQ